MQKYPSVSIIVPFYGQDESNLSGCIEALKKQIYPNDKIEIILVDNNNQFVLKNKIDSGIIILHEPIPGSYAARNKGINEANGEILAFTDSDCIANENWLMNAITEIINSNYEITVGGTVKFNFKNSNRPNTFEIFDTIFHFRQEYFINQLNFSVTANLISPKQVFEKCGSFDSNFFSGGDKEWGIRIKSKGVKMLFVENAIVYHPARASLKQLIQKNMRLVGGTMVFNKTTGNTMFKVFKSECYGFKNRRKILLSEISTYSFSKRMKLELVFFAVQLSRCAEAAQLLLGRNMKRA